MTRKSSRSILKPCNVAEIEAGRLVYVIASIQSACNLATACNPALQNDYELILRTKNLARGINKMFVVQIRCFSGDPVPNKRELKS